MNRQLMIQRPDDWHVHLREGDILKAVLPLHSKQYHRIVAMPNLASPIVSRERARAYHQEIRAALPDSASCKALIPCYLTEETSAEELIAGHQAGDFFGAKFYPVGATTHSHVGVADIQKLYPVFEKMQKHQVPLLMHGEVVDPDVDIYDRERVFVETALADLVRHFPELIMTMEHLTTKDAVDFVRDHQHLSKLAGSITLHHLMLTQNDMLNEGLRADMFCYPLVKTFADRAAVRAAATSGESCYFLGTDSAPHLQSYKYTDVARAGIFTAAHSLSGYLKVFDEENALGNFEAFASINGAQHYLLPINETQVIFQKFEDIVEITDHESSVGKIRNFQPQSCWRMREN